MGVGFSKRDKDVFALSERNFLTLKKLSQREIIGNTNAVLCDLNREMEITNRPTETSDRRRLWNELNLQHSLGHLLDDVKRLLTREEYRAIGERCDEIKTKFGTILCCATPTTLRECKPVRTQDDAQERQNIGDWGVDDCHPIKIENIAAPLGERLLVRR